MSGTTLGRDERAVSPVIAVILMVAITVVLAATVFVLTSRFSEHTGDSQGRPQLILLDATSTNSLRWVVAVAASGTEERPLNEFRISVVTPDATSGTIAFDSNTDFATGVDTWYIDLGGSPGAALTASSTPPAATDPSLRIDIADVSSDDVLNGLDEIRVSYDDADADGAHDDPLELGVWSLTVIHARSDGIAGTLEHQFG